MGAGLAFTVSRQTTRALRDTQTPPRGPRGPQVASLLPAPGGISQVPSLLTAHPAFLCRTNLHPEQGPALPWVAHALGGQSREGLDAGAMRHCPLGGLGCSF